MKNGPVSKLKEIKKLGQTGSFHLVQNLSKQKSLFDQTPDLNGITEDA